MTRRGWTRVVAALVLVLLAACGGPATRGDRVTLRWYVGPDRVAATALADACSSASDGRYTIQVVRLPEDADRRHSELVRRLAAKDDGIDLFTLDSAFTAEFARAGFLAPIPEQLEQPFAQDVFPAALRASSEDGRLVAAPWWIDPYLLWYRGLSAERAGLDATKPVTWDDLLAGAERVGGTVQIDDPDGQGLASWVDALVRGAGGTLLSGQGRSPRVGLDTEAGRVAAGIVEYYAQARLGAGPSDEAITRFVSRPGGFLLAPTSILGDRRLSAIAGDLRWSPYPVVTSDPAAPLTAASLAVPLYAPHSDLSYDAISCLTSATSMQQVMVSSGHGSARTTDYAARAVQAGYPMADVAKAAVESGTTLPATPYWERVRTALADTWSPVRDVSVSGTPAASQRAVRDAVAGRLR